MSRSVKKIILAVSGGIDSSVAAALMKAKRGVEVHGIYMKNWDSTEETGVCTGETDAEDAEWVCKKLNIPFSSINFVKEYWNDVFNVMLHDYACGYTPNPDILCNKYIKFDSFYKAALSFGADAIATGHYAQTMVENIPHHRASKKEAHLLQAKDHIKDQTFFLSQINQSVLQKTMFPIGHLLKSEVKKIAHEMGLTRITKKKESMGICFIGSRKFQNFISQYIPPNPGHMINIENGKVLCEHNGIHAWTIGQRCRIPGLKTSYFIVKKDNLTQDLIVAPGSKHPSLYTQVFFTSPPHWINPTLTQDLEYSVLDCNFRFQNTHKLSACKIMATSSNGLIVHLGHFLRAITPGQFAVFYKNGECLGSARIEHLGASLFELGLENANVMHDNRMKMT